jgi:hypothetical protein
MNRQGKIESLTLRRVGQQYRAIQPTGFIVCCADCGVSRIVHGPHVIKRKPTMIVGRHMLASFRHPGPDEHRLPRRHRRPALGGELKI